MMTRLDYIRYIHTSNIAIQEKTNNIDRKEFMHIDGSEHYNLFLISR